MHEFDTVSASSYDPSALAAKLTQRSAEGWEVVGIVPTGGDVTAFLRRDAGASSAAPADADTAGASMWSSDEPTSTYTPAAAFTPAEETSTYTPAASYTPEPAATYTPEPAATPEPASTYTPEPAASYTPEPAATYTPQVEEPAGWGATPAASEPTTTWTPAPEPAATPEPVVEQPTQQQPAAQTVPSVPAGWYADPAGRFELRYWDGGQWTEHVARGGAQYTDPPVA